MAVAGNKLFKFFAAIILLARSQLFAWGEHLESYKEWLKKYPCFDITAEDIDHPDSNRSKCTRHAIWAKEQGMYEKPDWYDEFTNLSKLDGLGTYQCMLWYKHLEPPYQVHHKKSHYCHHPCKAQPLRLIKDGKPLVLCNEPVDTSLSKDIDIALMGLNGHEKHKLRAKMGVAADDSHASSGWPWWEYVLVTLGTGCLFGAGLFCYLWLEGDNCSPASKRKRGLEKLEVETYKPVPNTTVEVPSQPSYVTTASPGYIHRTLPTIVTTADPLYAAPTMTYAAPFVQYDEVPLGGYYEPMAYAEPLPYAEPLAYAEPVAFEPVAYAEPVAPQTNAFDIIDTNHDGQISRAEFEAAMGGGRYYN